MKFISREIVVDESEVNGFIDCVELSRDYGEFVSEDTNNVYEQCIKFRESRDLFEEVKSMAVTDVQFTQDEQKGYGIIFLDKKTNGGPVIWLNQVEKLEAETILILGNNALLTYLDEIDVEALKNSIPDTKEELLKRVYFQLVPGSQKNGFCYPANGDIKFEYRLFFSKTENNTKSMTLKDDFLKSKNIEVSIEELHQAVLQNTPRFFPAKYGSMIQYLMNEELSPTDDPFGDDPFIPMVVVTNDSMSHGAGVIFYKNWLRDTFKQDLFILPSSVHECILMPFNSDYNVAELKDMVNEVNREVVSEEDFLSNEVYLYKYNENIIVKGENL